MAALEKELETYQRELPNLLAHEGEFTIIHGDEIAGYWDTYEDALRAGYDRYRLEPFLVKKIQGIETIYHFPRDLPPCRS